MQTGLKCHTGISAAVWTGYKSLRSPAVDFSGTPWLRLFSLLYCSTCQRILLPDPIGTLANPTSRWNIATSAYSKPLWQGAFKIVKEERTRTSPRLYKIRPTTADSPASDICLPGQRNSLQPHGNISPGSKVMGKGTMALVHLWFLEATNIHQNNMTILNLHIDLGQLTQLSLN